MTIAIESIADENLKKEFLAAKKGDTLRFNARLVDEMGGDEKKFRKYILSLPDDDERLVGDMFEGVIEEVTRMEIAELDEEFYSGYFGPGVSTKEEAMDQLKKGIAGFYATRANALLMREFQARLLELNKIELPDTFLKRWLGLNNEEITAENIEAEFPAFAENLRWTMLRGRLKEQFAIEATEEEIREEYARKVRNYFQAELPDHIIQSSIERLLEDKKNVEETVRDIETDKLFQALRSEVSIKDKPVPSDEFHEILNAITKKAEAEQNSNVALQETVE